jgi:protein-S-isoprenylcysteine O-methyltransferase Ste14
MDIPLFILATTISVYWSTVLVLVVYRRLQHGHSAGVFPRQRAERRLWRLIGPVWLGWNTLPWLALTLHLPVLALPVWATDSPVVLLRAVAALAGVGCYLLSLACWLRLGRSWTMAVVPQQDTQLVMAGPYRWVRHPIYSLSIVLMFVSALVLPTVPMVVLAALHMIGLRRKARHEEGHLLQRFGPQYAQYCEQVGRFYPKLMRKAG